MVNETPRRPSILSAAEKRQLLARKLQQKAQGRSTFPLSFAQQRLWFLQQLEPESPAYHIPLAFRIRGSLDPEVLGRCLRETVRRHEVLRTVFAEQDGRAVQAVAPVGSAAMREVDLRRLSPAEREDELRRLAGEESVRLFDLARGPLLRATLVRLAGEEAGLLLTMHHIVSDGWSMGVLVREVSALYDAFSRGAPSPLPELQMQYGEYASWQRGWLRGETLEEHLAWWREQMAGAPPVLELPTDRPHPAAVGTRGGWQPLTLPPSTVRALHALAREEGATLFMVLLAGWQALLARYSGQDDVVVGTPVAGRTRLETEPLVGFFVNTLALRARLEGDPSFRELLRRVRETTLGAFQHQALPFERLVEELSPERSSAHTPLFQVMFALQNNEREALRLGELRTELIRSVEEGAKFDLSLNLIEGGDAAFGSISYRAELWDPGSMERMAGHFGTLLEAVAAGPERPLGEVDLLSPEERGQVVGTWSRSRPAAAGLGHVHEAFARQAERTPGATAVLHGGDTVTYAQLDRRANRLAHLLAGSGVGPEVRVGVCLERSPDMLAAVLAVLKAGGTYVPLDPTYPAERIRYMVGDSGARVLLTQRSLLGVLPATSARVLAVDAGEAVGEADLPPGGEVDGENGAYVIYTSGTTGRPKGVVVPHRALAGYARAALELFGIVPADRVLQFASLSFDASAEEIYPTLLGGAALVLRTEDMLSGAAAFFARCAEWEVTLLDLTTAFWHELAAELERGTVRVPDSVRLVNFGGERAIPEQVAGWHRRVGGAVRLLNTYGPTEATVVATVAELRAGDDPRALPGLPLPPVRIGRPLPGARAYVLDPGLRLVPPGVPGELCLGGAGVARGYLDRPSLTAERFVPDPFAEEGGARMYRTGDRVRWLGGGELDFLGRVDTQIKLRGFRIEPAEIESALLRHPGVREAAVVLREDEPGTPRLVGYVVAEDPDAPPAPPSLRDALLDFLPGYMVPAAFVWVQRLPLTSSGKLDRGALPAPGTEADGGSYVAPRGATEEVLAAIWAEVLRLDRVGSRDSFFERGGHSLLATRVVSRVRQAFGTELPLRALFEAPTIAALAPRVDALLRRGAATEAPPLVPVPRDRPLPLSFAQQRLWFIDQLEPGSAAYNLPHALRVRGRLDLPALERSLAELVRRHETLRTTFATADREPVQMVGEAAPVRLTEEDFRGREAEARARARGEALRPFDLAAGPLFRAAVLRTGEEEWVLVLTLHHVVSDGWSMGVLTREVSALYGAYAAGESPALPELPVQYADYAVWQREWLRGATLERQTAWWRERLSGAPPLLELPVDRPRPPVQDTRGASRAFVLPAGTADALRALARREGATLFMTLLAGWQLLLSRYTGQDDLVVGTPTAGRTRLEVEGLIGFFVNTLALRTNLSGAPTFRELLARVREGTLGAFAHQDVPFEKLVEELAPERSLGHTPLFQAMFILQNAEAGELRLGALELESLPTGADAVAKFDLTLSLVEAGGRVAGSLSFRTGLWDAGTAERMLEHFRLLLEAVVADPARRTAEHEFLAPAERERILAGWNATAAPFPAETCVHRLFSAQARRAPEAAAVVLGGDELTYVELELRSSRLARYLRGRGVGPEVRVGICLERSPEVAVALLGVLKAGGAYVPLEPGYPTGRLAFMLRDARVKLVLTREHLLDRLPGDEAESVCLDRDWSEIERESGADPEVWVSPENLAYVIYTSGSTGVPKGVAVPHRGVVNYLSWAAGAYGMGPGAASPVHSPLAFDLTVTSLLAPLASGGRVVLVPESEGVEGLASVLRAEGGFGLVKITPAHLALLEGQLTPAEAARATRVFVVGGEALTPETAAAWLRLAPGTEIVNEYGPTETVVGCCVRAVTPEDAAGALVPIGCPIANTALYVLDRSRGPVPAGVAGELYIGGAGVARGYLDRPELTAERFVPDPFGAPGARLYRTGDLARHRADGTLEFLGRTDAQVKVRGFRIEPGEIEAALESHPGVREAVVIVREDAPGERRLAGYVVPSGSGVEPAELREFLRARLPEYMVPAALVSLPALPLTPSGKTDRRALPVPEGGAGEEHEAPRTATEEILAGIWAETLRVERVGAWDDFFALGGHSLVATRVVSRVREAFGTELPLRALFEAPTVAGLAKRVEALREGGAEVETPPLVRVPRDAAPLPLSFAQQRVWFLEQLQPGSAAYNMPFGLRLRGVLRVHALRGALSVLVERHEALRTVFAVVDGEPVQVVRPAAEAAPSLPMVDLETLPEAAREAELQRLASDEALRPFDLAAGPLLRSTLVRLGGAEHALLFTLHHVVSDGWSMGVLVREVSELYGASVEGRAPRLRELPVQYADYALWQRAWLSGDVLEGQLSYWRDRLAGAPPVLELPLDRPRPAAAGQKGAVHSFSLPAGLAGELRAVARREGATLFMTLLAGWQALLGRYSGQDDVVVGSPIANRTRLETEGLIGFFANTLALRTDLGGEPGARMLLERVREGTLGAYAHQEVPFERLVEELAPMRSLAYTPLFQAMLVLETQETGGPPPSLGGLRAEPLGTPWQTAKFDLNLFLREGGGAVSGALEYRTELFDRSTAARMLGHLRMLLEGMAADPARPVSDIDLLDPDERRQVVTAWNATAAPFGDHLCVHHLFEAQADRTPAAVAVRWAGGELTYAQLDERANRLGRFLRSRGVGVDTRVALCLERGPEMMVTVLGILKAGAAYVPLDPGYPAERLAYMLEDSAAPVLLTQEGLAGSLPAGSAEVVRLDAPDALDAISRESAARPVGPVGPDNLAYVVYTSGSTGRPKGVAMPHGPLANLLAWQERDWRAPAPAVTLQFATISFDASFHEVFSCWLTGGRLVLIGEETRYDPAAILEVVEREGVERLFLPAVALQHLAELADARGIVPSRLREVQTAGEALRVTEPLRRWLAALGAPLFNHYGPSETHVVTSLALEGDPREWPLLPSIGRPIANTRCYVLDGWLHPSPVGVPGELYLGGACLARGYLGQADRTAERFVPDAFSAAGGERLYRTGDRVRWLAGGEVEFLGRADDQVKVRGFRIEPVEVEAALERHPGVREAVVAVREDVPGDRRLVGYVVPAGGAEVSPAELRAHLKASLPEYMVPGAFVVLESLPLTPSGKVARRALPVPEGGAEGGSYEAPRTATEEIVAGIWAEVLRAERVGVREDFFGLGGHSLLATRVVSRVRDAFRTELPLRALFESPTVAGLAARIEALRSEGRGVEAPPLVRVPRGAPLPLSFAQQRLWLIDRLEPGSPAYTLPYGLRLRGGLDLPALRWSLGELVRRHEALRTVFPVVGDEPVQVVRPAPGAAPPLPVVDLGALAPEVREGELGRLVQAEAQQPFDLAAGPLLRCTLVRLGDAEWGLLFTLHHIVSDGWSMGVLVREVSALYGARSRGEASPLAELPVQYGDYAAWQRGWLSGEVLERELAYWRTRLAGAPPLLELPTDRPRTGLPGGRAGWVRLRLTPAPTRALRALSRAQGSTLYMTLLAAWQLLLSRYAGQEDVVVGSPVANRTRSEVEGLIGFFVNTLVLRTGVSAELSVRGLLGQVREGVLEAQAHQELPFEKLVEELAPERTLKHTPLFQVLFALQNTEEEELRLGEVRLERLGGGGDTSKFDLALTLRERGEEIEGGIAYHTALWDAATVERMGEHLRVVLEGLAAEPERRVGEVPILGAGERARVLVEWNAAGRANGEEACAHELFAARARCTPAAVAVAHESGTLTYAELDALSSRIAHALRRRGVGPEVAVGLCMEPGADMLAGLLGIWKAGGAYVPLDPAYPPERLAFMLEDADVPVLLAAGRVPDSLRACRATVLRLDADAAEIAGGSPEAPAVPVGPEGLAYVIYTSGSTGRPKGVRVEHRSLAATLLASREAFGLAPGDRVPSLASFAFDIWLFESVLPLLCGAAVRPLARDQVMDVPGLVEELAGCTALHAVPALMRQIVQVARSSGRGRLPGIRRVFVGGDAVPPDLLEEMREVFPAAEVHVLYGPTEAAVICVSHLLGEWAETRRQLLGRAMGNASLYVLDPSANPVPVGVPGELCLGGRSVARDYHGRPELTAGRFVPDPFSGGPGARAYRTGDRVRWGADGVMEFLGRIDDQVKIRGFRVEPGEVESAAAGREGVAEAVVVVREDAPGEKRLVCYVVPRPGTEISVAGLRAELRTRLPEYMVPSAIVVLERLPVTPNGKVDRAALPVPEGGGREDAFVPPRTPTEEILTGIWAEVLGRERVGAEDGFFDLGGHSLLATRVVSRVRDALGVEAPLRALFEAPVLAEFAGRIDALLREDGSVPAPPLVPVPRDPLRALPLSFAQRRLWFMDQMEPGRAAYNLPFALRLRGAPDVPALEWALAEVVRRHEALRTVFASVDGEPAQVIVPAAPVRIPVEDLRALPAPAREREVARRASEEALRPFDLAAGALLRVRLARLDADEWALFFTLHHIVSDGWSTGVLVREVSEAYGARVEGRAPVLPELPVQYADFAVWQREWLRGEALERQLAYWRERLAGAPPLLELPTDRPRPRVQGERGEQRAVYLPSAAAGALRRLSRREGATLFMTLLAGWQLLLSRFAGEEDVSVGTSIAGRTRVEVEGLIGFFVNTLVLRTVLHGDPSFRELVGRVREVTLGAYQHQDIPFERLVEELHPERSLAHTPLFQVMFLFQNNAREELRLGGLQVEALGAAGGGGATKFDLSLNLAEDAGGGVQGSLSYRTELFDAATVERMLEHFRILLEAVAAEPDASVHELELLAPAEREAVLAEWNATGRDYPDACIHELFEAQAARTPEAVALVFEGDRVSYAELDRRANRLARHLRRRGVRPEVRVALSLERSPGMVAAILAIFKAGGVYVPLDPTYPAERLAYQLEDSGAALLVTTKPILERLGSPVVEAILVDAHAGTIGGEGDAPVRSGATPDNLAYVVYTSGSTGRPKGVMSHHRGVVNYLGHLVAEYGLRADDTVLQLTTISFDASMRDLVGPLTVGARVVLVRADEVGDSARLLGRMREQRVSAVLAIVPSLLRPLLAAAGAEPDPVSLRLLLVSGEPLAVDDCHRARAAFGAGLRVVNLWGPTECTMTSSFHTVGAEEVGGTAPLGVPIANTRIFVLDGGMRPVPRGVPGEVYVATPGLARGYQGRPDLTAERFVPDPFAAEPGGRLYRVGDRVRRRGDGRLEFLGRTDQQVKVRGIRVEVGEVEAALRAHPAVRGAVVVADEPAAGEVRLVGYVVAAEEAIRPGELRGFLERTLPLHMVPSGFVRLDALPLLPNGKLDRRALPRPEQPSAEGGHTAPRTATEEILAGFCAEVLGIERVGAHDHFFELGGHSLLATRLVTRIRAAFGMELPLRAVFEAPTVEALAARIDAGRAGGRSELPPVDRVAEPGRWLPLSFAQQRLWTLHQLDSGSRVYNQVLAFRLRGRLDVAALRRALGVVVRRHAVFRTRFVDRDGVPGQVIDPPSPVALPVVDLAALPDAESVLRGIARAESRALFDLRAGGLLRVRLVRLAQAEHGLVAAMHHVTNDGWSTGIIYREVAELYRAFSEGRESPLPELPIQYADYAVWQRSWLTPERQREQTGYWRARLDAVPPLHLEGDRGGEGADAETHAFALAPGLAEGIRRLSRSQGATPFMTLLAAFKVLLHWQGRGDEVVVGTDVANRNLRAETEGLVGFFVNQLVLRTDLGGSPDFAELVRRVRETTLGAYDHQDVPFEQVVAALNPKRSAGETPFFRVKFSMHNAPLEPVELPGLALEPLPVHKGVAVLDLYLAMRDTGVGMQGWFEYRTCLFSRDLVARWTRRLQTVLEAAVADPGERLDRLEARLDAEARREQAEAQESLRAKRRAHLRRQ